MIGRILFGLGAMTLAAWALFALFGEKLMLGQMERVATSSIRGDTLAELQDGLHVMLCGAGSPMPDPRRAGPCALVVAGEHVFVFDIGSGAANNISPSGIPLSKVERVFLTHFHSDHIDGLGELSLLNWASSGRSTPLPVHGPEGVEMVVQGFNTAYQHDFGYRVAHHGAEVIPPSGAGSQAMPFPYPKNGEAVLVFQQDDLTISAFRVDHAPVAPAVGYRVDYKDRSLLISGDTDKSANLQRFAEGTDLLIHEALAPQLVSVLRKSAQNAGNERLVTIFDDILDYHTHPVQAAEIARDAKVGHLLFYHIVPAVPVQPMERIFLQGVSDIYKGPVTLGRDGTSISMRSGTDEILTGYLLPW